MAARDHVECHFRAMVPEHCAVPVGPFGSGRFLRPIDGQLQGLIGSWGLMQPKAKARRPASRAIVTNNACAETLKVRPTCRAAWADSQRCLIPAGRYHDPKRETGRNAWWRLTRADGQPWATPGEALGMLQAPPTERFDRAEARRTDGLLGRSCGRGRS